MSIAEEIQRLHHLHQSGALTDAEFALAKAKLLSSSEAEAFSQSVGQQTGFGADTSLQHLNQFRRSKTDAWFAGICGGLARTTGLDSWIWRLLFVFFSCYFGAGLLAYLLAWIFIPEE